MHNPVGSRRFIFCFFPVLIMNAVDSLKGEALSPCCGYDKNMYSALRLTGLFP